MSAARSAEEVTSWRYYIKSAQLVIARLCSWASGPAGADSVIVRLTQWSDGDFAGKTIRRSSGTS